MKTGNKIALFYTAITIGIISVVTAVFYFLATDYISRLYYSYLTEKATPTAELLYRYGGDIQYRIGWLLLEMLVISAVLVYFVGRLYATRMVDRIDAAYQSEKSFISNASHELNNPLTAIQGECEISLLKERTPAEYQAALGRIASETKRIIQLMKNLLFLSHGGESASVEDCCR